VYATLLGDSWRKLHPTLRRFHEADARSRTASGVFRVHAPRAFVTRLIARMAGMPPAGEAVPVALVVTVQPDAEEWRRTFGTFPLVSVQRIDGGLVAERFGRVEVRFRLEAVDGALRYGFEDASLRLGPIRMSLPLAASAIERPHGKSAIDVSVDVAMKGFGRLVAYEGTLTTIEIGR